MSPHKECIKQMLFRKCILGPSLSHQHIPHLRVHTLHITLDKIHLLLKITWPLEICSEQCHCKHCNLKISHSRDKASYKRTNWRALKSLEMGLPRPGPLMGLETEIPGAHPAHRGRMETGLLLGASLTPADPKEPGIVHVLLQIHAE